MSRICIKSPDGRHNFIVPGQDCFNGCGINQHTLSYGPPKEVESPIDRVLERIKNRPKFTSERQMWIQETADMLKVPFKSVLFKTIKWSMERIRDHYLQAIKQDNPQKYWWGIIKWQKAQQQTQVMNNSTQL